VNKKENKWLKEEKVCFVRKEMKKRVHILVCFQSLRLAVKALGAPIYFRPLALRLISKCRLIQLERLQVRPSNGLKAIHKHFYFLKQLSTIKKKGWARQYKQQIRAYSIENLKERR